MTRYLADRLSLHKMLHQRYIDKLKNSATHLLFSITVTYPNDLLAIWLNNLPEIWQVWHFQWFCSYWHKVTALRAPRLPTKCFTLIDCSKRIRDPTGISESQKKKPQSCGVWEKLWHQEGLNTCSLKGRFVPVQIKPPNHIQIAILHYNRKIINTIKSLSLLECISNPN